MDLINLEDTHDTERKVIHIIEKKYSLTNIEICTNDRYSPYDGLIKFKDTYITIEVKDRRSSKHLYNLIMKDGVILDKNKIDNCLQKSKLLVFAVIYYNLFNNKLKETLYLIRITKETLKKLEPNIITTQKSSIDKSKEDNIVYFFDLNSAFCNISFQL